MNSSDRSDVWHMLDEIQPQVTPFSVSIAFGSRAESQPVRGDVEVMTATRRRRLQRRRAAAAMASAAAAVTDITPGAVGPSRHIRRVTAMDMATMFPTRNDQPILNDERGPNFLQLVAMAPADLGHATATQAEPVYVRDVPPVVYHAATQTVVESVDRAVGINLPDRP